MPADRFPYRLFVLLFMASLCCGCAVWGSGTPIAFVSIAQGGSLNPDGRDVPALYIIAQKQQIESVVLAASDLNPSLSGNLQKIIQQLHTIDYQTSLVVIALSATKEGSSSITIDQVRQFSDHIQIDSTIELPWWFQVRPTVITDPYHIISISKSNQWIYPMKFQLMNRHRIIAEVTQYI